MAKKKKPKYFVYYIRIQKKKIVVLVKTIFDPQKLKKPSTDISRAREIVKTMKKNYFYPKLGTYEVLYT